jgi:hypothetical protein
MKNKFALVFVLLIAVFVALGCSSLNPFGSDQPAVNTTANRTANTATNANKSLTDQAVDTVATQATTGVPECDTLANELTAFANNPDDNFAVRMGKQLIANQIKESIRTTVEENQADKAQIAVACKELRTEFEKYKSGQPAEGKK